MRRVKSPLFEKKVFAWALYDWAQLGVRDHSDGRVLLTGVEHRPDPIAELREELAGHERGNAPTLAVHGVPGPGFRRNYRSLRSSSRYTAWSVSMATCVSNVSPCFPPWREYH
jgi:hypothetical protein